MARGDTPVWWMPQKGQRSAQPRDPQGSDPRLSNLAQPTPGADPRLGQLYTQPGGAGQEQPKDRMEVLLGQIEALYKELNMPFDPNSPEFKPIMDAMRQNTLSSSQMAGVYGPYSQNQAEQAYARGAAQLAGQRKSQALQTLGLLTGATGAQYDRQYAHDLDKWQQESQKSTDLWRLGGGILGGIGGGILGAAGGPAGIAAGATGGWQLGSNLGGAIGGATQKPLPNMPMTFGGY